MPFAAVATELKTGAAVVMRDQGDVPFAIRASCAIPGWYVPVTDEQGRQLVDGGLVAVIPATVTRSLGADIVIAVDVNARWSDFSWSDEFGGRRVVAIDAGGAEDCVALSAANRLIW